MLSFLKAILKEIKIVAPLLIHKTEQTLKYDPPFQDAGPRQNSLDILLERWIQNGGRGLDHSAHVVGLLAGIDRKSTRLNSSHGYISYAVFCLKKKTRTPVTLLSRFASLATNHVS